MELLLNLGLALIIGLAIGFERQTKRKAMGIQSTTLVILGSFTFTYISTLVGGDPARIIAQTVTGVGFIGAGLIFNKGDSIQNLTTAILVWTISAISCLVALGFRWQAIIITFVVMIVLHCYEYLMKQLRKLRKNEKF